MPPAAVKLHIEIGVAPPRHGDNALDRLTESVEMQPEMPCLAALGGGKHNTAARAHGRRAEQILGVAFGAHVSRRRPLVRRSCVVLGAPSGAKDPAAFFAAISTCASLGTSPSGRATRSATPIRCACT